MLIIFDLDDTLIDTSGSIVPLKLEEGLRRMVQEGLVINDFAEALETLKRLDKGALSCREALSEFLEINQADGRFFEIAVKEIYENPSLNFPIYAQDNALDVLAELRLVHTLAVVTIGREEIQLEKLKKAGIDSTIFSKICVSEERNKKNHYQILAHELGFLSDQVLVCGDRIRFDLTPAKELGFKTVHLRRGRGLLSTGYSGDVDYTISDLLQLQGLVLRLE